MVAAISSQGRLSFGDTSMEEKPTSPDQLTEREKEILERMATGLSDQQIAAALFLSSNTVRWYNRQIYDKLGVGNRTQAIAQARALGLLGPKDTSSSPLVQTGHQLPTSKRQKVEQRVHFTSSFDGTRIAYAIAGNGPPLVKAANYMSHQEYDWDSPVWFH